MAFRADEAATKNLERARRYLTPREATPEEREQINLVIDDVVERCGPVVDAYPTWHPLVPQNDGRNPEQYPSERCGYKGLDHTIYFVNGFITCPYVSGDAVLDSASRIKTPHCANIEAEELDAKLYNSGTKPILVRCEWEKPLDADQFIPQSLAVPLMLEQELPVWRWSQRGESWDTMRPYLLGEPHGSRSSLFVTQETALAIKKIYTSLIETGMFGPIINRR
jgi:hypothetical protein